MKFIELYEALKKGKYYNKYGSKTAYSIEDEPYITILGANAAMKMRNKKYPDREPIKHVRDVKVTILGDFNGDGDIFTAYNTEDGKKFAATLPKDIEIKFRKH